MRWPTLCTHRSVSGRALKSSSSAILKQFTLGCARNSEVVTDLGLVVALVDSWDGPKCVSLLISFCTDEQFLKARMVTGER